MRSLTISDLQTSNMARWLHDLAKISKIRILIANEAIVVWPFNEQRNKIRNRNLDTVLVQLMRHAFSGYSFSGLFPDT